MQHSKSVVPIGRASTTPHPCSSSALCWSNHLLGFWVPLGRGRSLCQVPCVATPLSCTALLADSYYQTVVVVWWVSYFLCSFSTQATDIVAREETVSTDTAYIVYTFLKYWPNLFLASVIKFSEINQFFICSLRHMEYTNLSLTINASYFEKHTFCCVREISCSHT